MTQEAGIKNRLRRVVLWAGLLLLLLLTGFSIYGAFIGAQRASRFFNSLPLSVYWLTFAGLLVAGLVLFKRLLQVRGLFLTHLGCIVILAGAIWGSRAGLELQGKIFKTDAVRHAAHVFQSGEMTIIEGQTQKTVQTEYLSQSELPFGIKLVDFRIEYYQPGWLIIQTDSDPVIKVPAQPGTQHRLGANLGTIEIVRLFENFKIFLEGDKRVAIDDPNGSPNPAVEFLLKSPDGGVKTKYAFERFPGHFGPDDKIRFIYRRTIRDFISDIKVIKDNKVVARKSIEVNKPLRFGGCIFYQQGYDERAGRFTVLRVTTDKGLFTVHLGFILLCAGVSWHLWLQHIFKDRVIED